MSDLMLDVDQAGEIKAALRRTHGTDGSEWTNGKIKKMSEGDFLGRVLDVLEGRAKIVPVALEALDTIIRVNRSVRPVYPDWMEARLHPKLEFTGPAKYTISAVKEWLHDKQKNGVVEGNVIYEHLKKTDILKDCLGLADLLAIQAKGLDFFRKHFAGKAVFGWKSVVRSRSGDPGAPCLTLFGGEVILDWYGLSRGWDSGNPALRFVSRS